LRPTARKILSAAPGGHSKDEEAADAGDESIPSVATAVIKSLGEVLRDARAGRFTIEELAALSNISSGRISQIERGLANPSFETLWRLSTALGVPIRALFPTGNSDKRQVVRRKERRRLEIPRDGLVYEMLTPSTNAALEILFLDIPSGYDGGARQPLSHNGDKFIHVRAGELVVRVAHNEWTLKEGDSITFDANEPHFVRNKAKARAQIQLVITPPSF
jgi:transcriptional regulator with XRE-family HTH domain